MNEKISLIEKKVYKKLLEKERSEILKMTVFEFQELIYHYFYDLHLSNDDIVCWQKLIDVLAKYYADVGMKRFVDKFTDNILEAELEKSEVSK